MLKGYTCDSRGGGKNRSEEKGAEKRGSSQNEEEKKEARLDGDQGKYQKVQLHAI